MIDGATDYVFGIDLSSFQVDVVWADVHADPGAFRTWSGSLGKAGDAFDRSRLVRGVLEPDDPYDKVIPWLYMVAGAIEEPFGRGSLSTAAGYRVQGAVIACIPPRITLQGYAPSVWKKRCGAGGGAKKPAVAAHLRELGYRLTEEHDENVSDALGIMHACRLDYLRSL